MARVILILQRLLASPARLRRALHVTGTILLLGGAWGAVIIWPAPGAQADSAAESTANPALPLAPADSGKQSREIEIYYGPIGVLYERWSEKAATLLHGKPLAKLILVSSAILAGGCFLAAARLPRTSL